MAARIRWSEHEIETRLRAAAVHLDIDRMPTNRELCSVRDGGKLANAVARRGGFDVWADRLGLERADHDSRKGWRWEAWFAEQCRARGMVVTERTRVKEKADVVVNGHTIDVKCAQAAAVAGSLQWTWRVAKTAHDVEFYALIALSDDPPIVFIVPAREASLTCMTTRFGRYGKRRVWLSRWDLLEAS